MIPLIRQLAKTVRWLAVGGKSVALERHPGDGALRDVRDLFVSDSRLSGDDISSDHVQVVTGGFERLLGIMVRNKSGVIIKGHIALPAETIKDGEQTGMFLVDARTHEIDDNDVVTRLTPRTESVTKHEPEGSLQHCFVSLLKTCFFIKSENLTGRGQLLIRAREEAIDLRPVNRVRFQLLHLGL